LTEFAIISHVLVWLRADFEIDFFIDMSGIRMVIIGLLVELMMSSMSGNFKIFFTFSISNSFIRYTILLSTSDAWSYEVIHETVLFAFEMLYINVIGIF
jgi:hypothetical protein